MSLLFSISHAQTAQKLPKRRLPTLFICVTVAGAKLQLFQGREEGVAEVPEQELTTPSCCNIHPAKELVLRKA